MDRVVVLAVLLVAGVAHAQPCKGRKGCKVLDKVPAGTDAKGRELSVMEVELAVDEAGSRPTEHWLEITEKGKGRRKSYELVLELSNDGNGAAHVGEDSVGVEDNRLVHTSSGGSAWRWDFVQTWQLTPHRLLTDVSNGSWTLGPNEAHTEMSWETLSGKTTWWSPPCGPDGDPLEVDPKSYEYLHLPVVPVAFDWKQIGLGHCGALVDGKTSGFTTYGKPADAKDAWFRVLAVDERTLVVEIEDDVWQGPGAKWLFDDHVEIWAGTQHISYMDHCIDEKADAPVQWGIRVADGAVFPAFGKPDGKLPVERVQVGPRRVRLKITLPQRYEMLSVVYSDSDDGKRQERLIATSRVIHGKPASLGELEGPVDPKSVTCVVRGGQLEPALAP